MKRLYIIECDFYVRLKYSGDDPEKIIRIYEYDERQKFIREYEKFIKQDLYYDNVRCYYCNYEDCDITDKMDEIKNNI